MSLAGLVVPGKQSKRVFYAEPDNGVIVSFFSASGNTTWSAHQQDSSWGTVDGGLAVVGYEEDVRLFYFQKSQLYMSPQNGVGWEPAVQLG